MYIDLQEYQEFSKPAFTREGLIVQFPRRVTGITRDGSRILLHLQAMVCRKEPVVISALMQGRTFRFTGQWAPMTASLEFLPPRTLRLRLADGEGLPPHPPPQVQNPPGTPPKAQGESLFHRVVAGHRLEGSLSPGVGGCEREALVPAV